MPGRKPTTGRFATRGELEMFIHERADANAYQKNIAAEAGVSEALVSDLLSARKQRAITHFRKLRGIK